MFQKHPGLLGLCVCPHTYQDSGTIITPRFSVHVVHCGGSSSSGGAECYVLPVSWMTSRFDTLDPMLACRYCLAVSLQSRAQTPILHGTMTAKLVFLPFGPLLLSNISFPPTLLPTRCKHLMLEILKHEKFRGGGAIYIIVPTPNSGKTSPPSIVIYAHAKTYNVKYTFLSPPPGR